MVPKSIKNGAKLASQGLTKSKWSTFVKMAPLLSESFIFEVYKLSSWIKNGPKFESRKAKNQDAILDGFLMALGSILGRFGRPSWGQVGSKIDLERVQKRCQKIIKKIWSRGGHGRVRQAADLLG